MLGISTANLAAFMLGVDPDGVWATAALVWVAARIAHGIAYIVGLPVLRVACFVLGMVMNIWIFTRAFAAA